jgi:Flp pilus assembly protein TadD
MNHVPVTSDRPLGVTLDAEELDALYSVGHDLYERAEYPRAAEVFRLLVATEPLHVEGWQALGACHEQLDDLETASGLYEIGYRMGGNEPKLGFLCARAAWLDGDAARTRDMLEDLRGRELDETIGAGVRALEQLVARAQ